MPQPATRYAEIFTELARHFEPGEVKSRTQAGRKLHYITARTAMNRLDEVLGPENWWDEYIPGENSVVCKLTICLPDGVTRTKCDAGGYAGMADQGDDDKSGFTDAFKRACVKFGVSRYLYNDGEPDFGQEPAKTGNVTDSPPAPSSKPEGNVPRSGRALFAWAKEQEQKHQVGLIKYLNGWAKLQDYPDRMVDWDQHETAHAYAEACQKLKSVAPVPHPPSESDSSDGPLRLTHEPDGTWLQPKTGQQLFNELNRFEGEYGGTLIKPVIDWAASHDQKHPMANWDGRLLHDAWIIADEILCKIKGPAKPTLSPEHRECWKTAKAYLKQVYQRDHTDAEVFKLIQDQHVHHFGGETMESFKGYTDLTRLKQLTAFIEKDRADADDIPF